MPSKALLHAATIHAAGGDHSWRLASDFRDWMIVRERPLDWPDDSGHVNDLEAAGTVVIRGEARIDGPGKVVATAKRAVRTDHARRLAFEGELARALGCPYHRAPFVGR